MEIIDVLERREDCLECLISPLVKKISCMDHQLAITLINTYALRLRHLRKEGQMFKEFWTFPQGTPAIDIALRYGDYKFAKCIINYNINSSIVDIQRDLQEKQWVDGFRVSLTAFIFIVRIHQIPVDHPRRIIVWKGLSREVSLKSSELLEWEKRPTNTLKRLTRRGFKRIILMMKLFPVLYAHLGAPWESEEEKGYVDCAEICFRLTPEPSITKDEMREFLEFFFGHLLPSPKAAIKYLTNKFEKLFRSKADYEPRSLKHLCRISVRQNLRDKNELRAFPALVKDLDYPKILKSYLLCEY